MINVKDDNRMGRTTNTLLKTMAVVPLLLITTLTPSSYGTEADSCTIPLSHIEHFVDLPVAKLPFDVPPKTFSQGELKLRELVMSHPDQFNALIRAIEPEDVIELKKALEMERIDASQEAVEAITALALLAKEDGDLVWNKRTLPTDALQTHKPGYRWSASSGKLGGVIAGIDTHALTALEGEMVDDLVNRTFRPRVKRGNPIKRFFFHPFWKIEKIVNYNNQARDQLEHVAEANSAVGQVYHAAKALEFNPTETEQIRTAKEIIESVRADARDDLEKAYGQDITTGGWISTPDADIYTYAKRIDQQELLQSRDEADYIHLSEEAIENMHQALSTRMERDGEIRNEGNYFPSELKIRNRQRRRQTGERLAQEEQILSEKSKPTIVVDYHYYIYVPKTVSNGKGGTRIKLERKRIDATDTVHPSYYHVIHDRLERYSVGKSYGSGSIDAVRGKAALLRSTENVAYKEGPLRSGLLALKDDIEAKIDGHLKFMGENGKNPKEMKARVKELKAKLQKLRTLAEELDSYKKWGIERVRNNWVDDNHDNFKRRTEELSKMTEKLDKLFLVYTEQVRRNQIEVAIEPDLPDYSPQFKILRRRAMINMAIKVVLGSGGSSTGACLAMGYEKEELEQCGKDALRVLAEVLRAFAEAQSS